MRAFMDDVYRYNNGGVSSSDYINQLNEVLLKKNLFVDLNALSYLNVLAVDDVVSAKLENSALKTTRTSKGCIVVRFKKRTLFEIWVKFNLDKYDFIVSDNLVSFDRDRFNGVIEMSDYTYKEAWHLKHLCRVPSDKFEDTVNVLLSLAEDFIANENTNDTKEEE